MPTNYRKPWTEQDKQRLQFWWGAHTVKTIAKRLERTPHAITAMARDLQLGPPSRGLISLEQFEKQSGFSRTKIEAAAHALNITLKRVINSVPEERSMRRFAVDEDVQEKITQYMLDNPTIFTNKSGNRKTTQGAWGVGWKPERCLSCGRNDLPHYSKGRCRSCARQHVRERKRMSMDTPIYKFTGVYRFLSNFFPSTIEFESSMYLTVEHAYQAAKTTDLPLRRALQLDAGTELSISPGRAKRWGRSVPLRKDWEGVKLSVMEQLLRTKFEEPGLRGRLLLTGDRELIEGNTWGDRFWGACELGGIWEGENHLGKLLMKIRDEIRRQEETT